MQYVHHIDLSPDPNSILIEATQLMGGWGGCLAGDTRPNTPYPPEVRNA